jgi:hypothetical protein
VGLHAEVPVLSLFRLVYSGSRFSSRFFVYSGAEIRASTIVPSRIISPLLAKCALISPKMRPRKVVPLKQAAELEQRRRIRGRLAVQVDAEKVRIAWLS